MDSVYVNGTVQLDGYEYSIIADKIQYIGDHQAIAAMREDTVAGKVWVRFFNQDFTPYAPDSILNHEYLVADYSLTIGDTVAYTYIADVAYNFYPIDISLTVVDTGNVLGRHYVELNSTSSFVTGSLAYHGFTSFNDNYSYYAVDHLPLRFYEGVGPSQGPLAPFGGSNQYPADSYMTCSYEDGIQIWSDPNVSTCDLPDGWVSDELLSNSSTSKIEIYPNPNDGRFQIKLEDSFIGKEFLLNIHSIDGRIIKSQSGRIQNSLVCQIPSPVAGIYFLTITIDNEMQIIKFTIF